ncbi:MAG: glycosyltransferase [Candidatus Ancaeobacter aquaticus]|nr:glycosyltransferase [Candidatus Ancaeobacter aquaticus]
MRLFCFVRNNGFVKVIALAVTMVFLCQNIAWASPDYRLQTTDHRPQIEREKLATKSLLKYLEKYTNGGQELVIKSTALDEFLKDEKTRESIFKEKKFPALPPELEEFLGDFFKVDGHLRFDDEKGIASLPVILGDKAMYLTFFKDPQNARPIPEIQLKAKDIPIVQERAYRLELMDRVTTLSKIAYAQIDLDQVEVGAFDVLVDDYRLFAAREHGEAGVEEPLYLMIEDGIERLEKKDPAVAKVMRERIELTDPRDEDALRYLSEDIQWFLAHERSYYRSSEEPRVSFVILHYGRKPDDTLRLLKNLSLQTYKNFDVIIVDNNSPDNFSGHYTEADLAKKLGRPADHVKLISNKVNLGYTGGNNQASREALKRESDYIFYINNDAMIEKDCLEKMLDIVKDRDEIGAVQPSLYVYKDDKDVETLAETGVLTGTSRETARIKAENYANSLLVRDGRGLVSGTSNLYYKEPTMLGTAQLVRSDMIRLSGGFDTRFHTFADEGDIGYSYWKTGLKKALISDIYLAHPQFESAVNFRSQYLIWKNYLLLSQKYYHRGPIGREIATPETTLKNFFNPDTERVRSYLKNLIGHDDFMFIGVFKGISDGLLDSFAPTRENEILNENERIREYAVEFSKISDPLIVLKRLFAESDPYQNRLMIFALHQYRDMMKFDSTLDEWLKIQLQAILYFYIDQWKEWVMSVEQKPADIAKIRANFAHDIMHVMDEYPKMIEQLEAGDVKKITGLIGAKAYEMEEAINMLKNPISDDNGKPVLFVMYEGKDRMVLSPVTKAERRKGRGPGRPKEPLKGTVKKPKKTPAKVEKEAKLTEEKTKLDKAKTAEEVDSKTQVMRSDFPIVIDVYDPKEVEVLVKFHDKGVGRFVWDRRNVPTLDGVEVNFQDIAESIEVMVRPIEKDQRHENVCTYSYGNFLNNDWFVIYDGSTRRLLHRLGEPVYERKYTMVVVWNDGRKTGEEVRFQPGKNKGEVKVYLIGEIGDQSSKIKSAFFGQRLVHKGNPVGLEENNLYNQFDDLYHLFFLPQFVEVVEGRNKYGDAIGHDELFVDFPGERNPVDRTLLRDVLANDGYMDLDLTAYLAKYTLQKIKDNALATRGYKEKEGPGELNVGEYRIVNNRLQVRLIRGKNPQNLIGITESGKVVMMDFTGDKSIGVGYTIEELQSKAIEESRRLEDPLQEVFLLANSRDVVKRINGKVIERESAANPRSKQTALIVVAELAEAGVKTEIPIPTPDNFLERLQMFIEKYNKGNLPSITAIGDIHGNDKKLDKILKYQKIYSQERRDEQVVFMGDYINRDPDGLKVMRRVRGLVEADKAVALMGNHEPMFITAILGKDVKSAIPGVSFSVFEQWIFTGGGKVIEELGGDIGEIGKNLHNLVLDYWKACDLEGKEKVSKLKSQLMKKIKKNRDDIRDNKRLQEEAMWMLKNLKLYHIDENLTFYIHASVGPIDQDGNLLFTYNGKEGFEALSEYQKKLEKIQEALKDKEDLRDHSDIVEFISSPQFISNDLVSQHWWFEKLFMPGKIEPGETRKVFSKEEVKPEWVNDKAVDNLLRQLGALRIVYGHSVQEDKKVPEKVAKVFKGRICGIDWGISEEEQASVSGGFLVIGQDGVKVQLFKDRQTVELKPETNVIDGNEMLAQASREIAEGRAKFTEGKLDQTPVTKINNLSASELRSMLREGYKSGQIKWDSQYKEWKKLQTEKDKISAAGVLVLRKINGEWCLLLAQRNPEGAKDKHGFFVTPVGAVDHPIDFDIEIPEQIQELTNLGIISKDDLDPDGKRESIPGAAVRELREETKIKITIADLSGRVSHFRGDHEGILLNYMVYIDDSEDPMVAKTKELTNPQWVPLSVIMRQPAEHVGKEVEKYLQGIVPGCSLMHGMKTAGMKYFQSLIREVMIIAEAKPPEEVSTPSGKLADGEGFTKIYTKKDARTLLKRYGINDDMDKDKILGVTIPRWMKSHNLFLDSVPYVADHELKEFNEIVDVYTKYRSLKKIEEFILSYARGVGEEAGTQRWVTSLKRSARQNGVSQKKYLTGVAGPHKVKGSDSPLIWAAKGRYYRDAKKTREGKLFGKMSVDTMVLKDMPIWPVDSEGNILHHLLEWIKLKNKTPTQGYYNAPKKSLAELFPSTLAATGQLLFDFGDDINGQIGKRAYVKDVSNERAVVIDHKGDERDIDLTAHAAIDMKVFKIKISENIDNDVPYKDMLNEIIEMYETSPPKIVTYSELVDDLFGFAGPEKSVIALYKTLASNPLVQFHEILEYLILSKKMKISYSNNALLIEIGDKSHAIQLTEEANAIALKDPLDYHYLIRALAREMSGENDKALTHTIKNIQIIHQIMRDLEKSEEQILKDLRNILTENQENRFIDEEIAHAVSKIIDIEYLGTLAYFECANLYYIIASRDAQNINDDMVSGLVLILRKDLGGEVYESVARVLGTIWSTRSDLVGIDVMNAILERLLANNVESSKTTSILFALLNEIVSTHPEYIQPQMIDSIKAILESEDYLPDIYREAIRFMIVVAQEEPSLIDISTVKYVEKLFESQALYEDGYVVGAVFLRKVYKLKLPRISMAAKKTIKAFLRTKNLPKNIYSSVKKTFEEGSELYKEEKALSRKMLSGRDKINTVKIKLKQKIAALKDAPTVDLHSLDSLNGFMSCISLYEAEKYTESIRAYETVLRSMKTEGVKERLKQKLLSLLEAFRKTSAGNTICETLIENTSLKNIVGGEVDTGKIYNVVNVILYEGYDKENNHIRILLEDTIKNIRLYVNGEEAGYATVLVKSIEDNGEYIYYPTLQMIKIFPKHQGKGYAKLMMRSALLVADHYGFKELFTTGSFREALPVWENVLKHFEYKGAIKKESEISILALKRADTQGLHDIGKKYEQGSVYSVDSIPAVKFILRMNDVNLISDYLTSAILAVSKQDNVQKKQLALKKIRALKIALLKIYLNKNTDIDAIESSRKIKEIINRVLISDNDKLINALLLNRLALKIPANGVNGVMEMIDIIIADPHSVLSMMYSGLVNLDEDSLRYLGIKSAAISALKTQKQDYDDERNKEYGVPRSALEADTLNKMLVACTRGIEWNEKIGIVFDASGINLESFDSQMNVIRKVAKRGVEIVVGVADGNLYKTEILYTLGNMNGITIIGGAREELSDRVKEYVDEKIETGQWKRITLLVSDEYLSDYTEWVALKDLALLLVTDRDGTLRITDIAIIKKIGLHEIAQQLKNGDVELLNVIDLGPPSINDADRAYRMLKHQA